MRFALVLLAGSRRTRRGASRLGGRGAQKMQQRRTVDAAESVSSGGGTVTSQGAATGGAGSAGGTVTPNSAPIDTGGGTGVAGPCEDVEPPPDPEWPDATCETWATETEECDAAWFSKYCDVSCGRCVPEGGLPEQPQPSGPDCSAAGLPNVTGGEGFATRYWDCCQPHCSQFNGHRCSQDGVSRARSISLPFTGPVG